MLRQYLYNSAVCFSLCLGTATAQVVNDGATNTLNNVTNLLSGGVLVGSNGTGTLLVLTNGALLSNTFHGAIGANASANSNTVRLSGANTRWLTGNLFVGSNGSFNRLFITDGARVAASGGISTIGYLAGSRSNELWVSGAGSVWSNLASATIGFSGSDNRLVVSNGGLVLSDTGYLGRQTGSRSNSVIITGAGSLWSNQSTLRVGFNDGGNRLVIENGGAMVTDVAYLGSSGLSTHNTALVTGAGSLFSILNELYVGGSGGTNQLVVSNGGTVSSGYAYVGSSTTIGDGNSAVVTGAGSLWSNQFEFAVGYGTRDNRLTVSDGGRLVTTNASIGFTSSAFNNQALATGTNSEWVNQGDLFVGYSGGLSRLVISNGATVNNGDGYLGYNSTSGGNVAVVTGAGSAWTNHSFYVGYAGAGNQLVVSNGGVARSLVSSHLGQLASSSNNVAVVTGAGSLWTNDVHLYVGGNGAGNQLVVSNGGVVRNIEGTLGLNATSSNNVAVVSGAGSLWHNLTGLTVGNAGAGNQLVVLNGGLVRNNETSTLGLNSTSSNNVAVVSGAGSVWYNSINLTLGTVGRGNRLVVSNGGAVLVFFSSFVGLNSTSRDNMAVVTGEGSLWATQSDLQVGGSGGGNQLVVSDGGVVRNNAGYLGYFSSLSSNNLAVVTGAGSLWSNRTELVVGNSGGGNRLVVSNGGTVFASNQVVLGANTNALNNRIIVDGGTLRAGNGDGTGTLEPRRGTNVLNAGLIEVDHLLLTNTAGVFEFNGGTLVTRSAMITNGNSFIIGASGLAPATWDVRAGVTNHLVRGTLVVGGAAPASQLLITNGALLTNLGGSAVSGVIGGSDSNSAWLTGVNSRWLMPGNLQIGSNSSFNRLVVSNGAQVRSQNGIIGLGGVSNEAVVSGAGSRWTNGGNLEIGSVVGGNRLRIADGAVVNNSSGIIGAGAGSTGNEALVTGAGALWSNRVTLLVGSQGSQNRLMVSNGGTVVTPNLYLGAQSSSVANRVEVDGGALRVVGPGQYDLRRGTNVLNSGLVEAHVLMVTNAASAFEFNGGTLITRTTTNDNGRLFRVGNGTSPATLQLDGGTHLFANTLLINSNAALTGNGFVFGTITNRGNISPGTSAGAIRAGQTLRLTASSMMTFEIGGLIPTNDYDVVTVGGLVELAGTLSLELINNFLPEPEDTFTLLTFGAQSGSFANIMGGRVSLTNNLASFAVTQTATNLQITGVSYVDTDGDGQGDLQEQLAGTDPNDPRIALEITSLTRNASGHLVLQFQYVPGKSYRVEFSDDLVTWSSILSPSLSNPLPGIAQWIDDGSLTGGLPAGPRYYRVGLQ